MCRLVGLVVRHCLEAGRPEFDSCLSFFGSSHTTDLKTGTPVAALPGSWHCRVSAGPGWPSVRVL